MDDKADPLDGWPILEVKQMPSPADQDVYGKLFIYLHDILLQFLDRFQKVRINFDLHSVDVNELPEHLQPNTYSRIEVSNICDNGYVGIRKTLSLLSPFLQTPEQNPHATFITLFINAVKETAKMGGEEAQTPDMKFLGNYLPLPNFSPRLMALPGGILNDADMLRIWDARDLALDMNKFFEQYMIRNDFSRVAADLHLEMKKNNSVAEKWPTQLKLKLGDKGAEEEFRLNLGSGVSCVERYVEWRKREALQ